MPNISRTRRYNSAFVNVRVRTQEDFGDECPICLRTWCSEDACNRTMVQTNCCFQFLCAACATKISMICRCEDDCPNIVYICPFCRNITKTVSSTLFVGAKRPCKKCRDSDVAVTIESPEEERAEDDQPDVEYIQEEDTVIDEDATV